MDTVPDPLLFFLVVLGIEPETLSLINISHHIAKGCRTGNISTNVTGVRSSCMLVCCLQHGFLRCSNVRVYCLYLAWIFAVQ
jgi:hypothetical protein